VITKPEWCTALSEIDLVLCGDVMLGRGIDQILRHPSPPRLYEECADSALDYVSLAEEANGRIPRHVEPAYVWGDALAILEDRKPAARIINLETAITRSSKPWPKVINYRMHPDNIACLTAAQIDYCVLANNHMIDWGRAGLLETVATLSAAGIRTAGAGQHAAEAAAPAVLPLASGGRAVIYGLASTTSGVPRDWAATAVQPGVNLLPDLSVGTATSLAEAAQVGHQPGDLLIAQCTGAVTGAMKLPICNGPSLIG
jgi:poly-gamma-glutamate synthesis protein (capsule biosynthesis protein)